MAEDRPVRTTIRTTDGGSASRSENKGLTQSVEMPPVAVPEPVAPTPTTSDGSGGGSQGGGTPPADFDG